MVDLVASGLEAAGTTTGPSSSSGSSTSGAAEAGKRKRAKALGQLVGSVVPARALSMMDYVLAGASQAAVDARQVRDKEGMSQRLPDSRHHRAA